MAGAPENDRRRECVVDGFIAIPTNGIPGESRDPPVHGSCGCPVGSGFRRECDYFFLRALRVFAVNRGIVIASEAKQSRADSSAPEATP